MLGGRPVCETGSATPEATGAATAQVVEADAYTAAVLDEYAVSRPELAPGQGDFALPLIAGPSKVFLALPDEVSSVSSWFVHRTAWNFVDSLGRLDGLVPSTLQRRRQLFSGPGLGGAGPATGRLQFQIGWYEEAGPAVGLTN